MVIQLKRSDPAVDSVEAVRLSRERLGKARELLLNGSLDGCAELLSEAVELLRPIEQDSEGPPFQIRPEIRNLRSEVGVIAALLSQAATYYAEWARILSASANGYTQCGEVAALTSSARLSLEG